MQSFTITLSAELVHYPCFLFGKAVNDRVWFRRWITIFYQDGVWRAMLVILNRAPSTKRRSTALSLLSLMCMRFKWDRQYYPLRPLIWPCSPRASSFNPVFYDRNHVSFSTSAYIGTWVYSNFSVCSYSSSMLSLSSVFSPITAVYAFIYPAFPYPALSLRYYLFETTIHVISMCAAKSIPAHLCRWPYSRFIMLRTKSTFF